MTAEDREDRRCLCAVDVAEQDSGELDAHRLAVADLLASDPVEAAAEGTDPLGVRGDRAERRLEGLVGRRVGRKAGVMIGPEDHDAVDVGGLGKVPEGLAQELSAALKGLVREDKTGQVGAGAATSFRRTEERHQEVHELGGGLRVEQAGEASGPPPGGDEALVHRRPPVAEDVVVEEPRVAQVEEQALDLFAIEGGPAKEQGLPDLSGASLAVQEIQEGRCGFGERDRIADPLRVAENDQGLAPAFEAVSLELAELRSIHRGGIVDEVLAVVFEDPRPRCYHRSLSFQRLPTGRGLRCGACGGGLSGEEAIHERLTRCPHCGACEELPPELREELRTHQSEVGQGIQRISGDRRSQAVIEGQLALRPRHYPLLFAPLFLFTAPTLWTSKMGPTVYAVSLLGGWVLYFVYLSWIVPRLTRSAALADTAATIAGAGIRCPTCGGANVLRVDAAIARCRFCEGALSPDSDTLARVRERIRRAEGAAEQERRATEWRAAAKRNRDMRTDRIPVVLVGFFVALLVLAGLSGLVRALFFVDVGEKTASPQALALVAGIPGTLYGLWLRQRRRFVARIDAALAKLAATIGGEVERHPQALARWLGEHWLGPFDPRLVCAGRHYAALFAEQGGVPLMISSCPYTEENTPAQSHLRILVAVPSIRPLMAATQAARSTIARLSELGFGARVFAAGWMIEATKERVEELQRCPEALAGLAEIVETIPSLTAASLPSAT